MVEYVKNVNIRSGEKEPGAKWGMFFHPMHLFLKRIKNGKKNFVFLKLNAMRHNIIVIQVLDRVYNVTFLA
jgi:hypothetical protein